MPALLRRATPADRPDLIALALAEDRAWSDAPAVSAEEVGDFGFKRLESAHRVDGRGEAGVRRHLDEDFPQLLDREPDVPSRVQVDVELGFAAALGSEHGHGGELAVPQRQPWAGVDVAEGKLDDVAAEIAERVHDGLTGGAVNLGELLATAGVAVMCRSSRAQAFAPVARSW